MKSPHDFGHIFTNVILKDLLFLASIKFGTKPNFVDRSFSGYDTFSALKRIFNQESRVTCSLMTSQMVSQFREYVKFTKSTAELAHMLDLLPKAIQGVNNLAQTYMESYDVRNTLHTVTLKLAKLIKTIRRRISILEREKQKKKDAILEKVPLPSTVVKLEPGRTTPTAWTKNKKDTLKK